MKRRRRTTHTDEWHAARLDEGPTGFIRSKGVTSWDQLQAVMQGLMAHWERMPEADRSRYAFPNPEDRRL